MRFILVFSNGNVDRLTVNIFVLIVSTNDSKVNNQQEYYKNSIFVIHSTYHIVVLIFLMPMSLSQNRYS